MSCHLSGQYDVPDCILCSKNMHCSVTAAKWLIGVAGKKFCLVVNATIPM